MSDKMNGHAVECSTCGGAGVREGTVIEPWSEECGDCGGKGNIWMYEGGALAEYYGGPLIGRIAPPPSVTPDRSKP